MTQQRLEAFERMLADVQESQRQTIARMDALKAQGKEKTVTFRQLMMQVGRDSVADAGFHCNVCIVEDGGSLLIYVLYDG